MSDMQPIAERMAYLYLSDVMAKLEEQDDLRERVERLEATANPDHPEESVVKTHFVQSPDSAHVGTPETFQGQGNPSLENVISARAKVVDLLNCCRSHGNGRVMVDESWFKMVAEKLGWEDDRERRRDG